MGTSIGDFIFDVSLNQNTYKAHYKKKVREADTDVQEFQDSLAEFQKNVKKLRKYDSRVTTSEKIKTQLADMVKSYNNLLGKYSNVNNKDISKNMEKLEEIFDNNNSILRKIGVRKDGNTWKFSENSFDSLDTNEAKKYCTQLFKGRTSYINQINTIIDKIDKSAEEAEYNTKVRKFSSTVKYTQEEVRTAYSLSSMKNTISNLCDYVKKVELETLESDKIGLEVFVLSYNNFLSNSENLENEYVQAIKNYHNNDDIKNQFSKVGITFGSTGDMMYDNTTIATKDSTYCNTFNALFAEDSSYAKTMKTHCKNAIDELLKVKKYGITFDEII